VVRDDIIIVDRGHRIVAVVPVGSGSAQAPSGPSVGGGGGAVGLNLSPEEIRQVQIVLKERRLYDGPIDGVFGPRLRTAVIAFQRSQGFALTGQIDTRTVTALNVNVRQNTTTGQGGMQQPADQQGQGAQQPANQQGMQGGQQPANQQGMQGGQQPSTTGQGTQQQPSTSGQGTQGSQQPTQQQPPANQPGTSGQGGDRMQQQSPAGQAPQSGAPAQSGGQAK
jgi:peptidoglycan hydrolase-like protein with peptidoglycan-binding domain